MLITPLEFVPVVVRVTVLDLEFFALIAGLSIAYSVAVRRIERLRRGLTENKTPTVIDVWTMAGALLLPPLLIVVLVIVVYAAEWPSRRIVGRGRLGHYVVSAGVVVLAALAASETDHLLHGFAGLLAAFAVWSAVNISLIFGMIWLFDDRALLRMFLSVRGHVLDLSTKVGGALLAVIVSWHMGAAALMLPLMLVGHRLALRDTIRSVEAFDAVTGLWSEGGWRIQASQVITDAPGCVVLMLIDPELTDQEAQIAGCLTGLRRPTDPIGRYGTRQVALLSQVDLEPAGIILIRRIRDRLSQAGISCLVGTSISAGEDLDVLLMRAGSDLMQRRAAAGISARW
jgi:hypothetical protein